MHEKAEYFRELWGKRGRYLRPDERDRDALRPEQQDKIGVAYLEYIVGADKREIADFIDRKIHSRSRSLGPIIYHYNGKNDVNGFWDNVEKVATNLHFPDEISYLKEQDDPQWSYFMLNCLHMSTIIPRIIDAGYSHHFSSCELVGCKK